MASGIPLNDEDRAPWLQILNEHLKAVLGRNSVHESDNHSVCIVLACSALKRKYRVSLLDGINRKLVRFVLLDGSKDVILARLKERANHFMKPGM